MSRLQTCALVLASLSLSWAPPAASEGARPPAPGSQPACLVWWQATDHLGETVTICGTPRETIEQDGVLYLFLGPQSTDLRAAIPLELRDACPEAFAALEGGPMIRLRASGELLATPDGPVLMVTACNDFSVQPRTF